MLLYPHLNREHHCLQLIQPCSKIAKGTVLWPELVHHSLPGQTQKPIPSGTESRRPYDCAGDKALRDKLLSAIKENKDDDIEKALRALSEQNPTRAPAKSDKLFGKWKLLWASPNSEVAKATRRNPLPSYSEQLIGVWCLLIPSSLSTHCGQDMASMLVHQTHPLH